MGACDDDDEDEKEETATEGGTEAADPEAIKPKLEPAPELALAPEPEVVPKLEPALEPVPGPELEVDPEWKAKACSKLRAAAADGGDWYSGPPALPGACECAVRDEAGAEAGTAEFVPAAAGAGAQRGTATSGAAAASAVAAADSGGAPPRAELGRSTKDGVSARLTVPPLMP
jgi:hypothetical protein